MKRIAIALLGVLASTGVSSCFTDWDICPRPQGPNVTETLSMPSFEKIRLLCDAKVYISQGNTQQVIVEGPSNMITLLDDDVLSDGTWNIALSRCVSGSTELTFYIQIPNISSVINSSSGDIIGETQWASNYLEIRAEGSGEIWANVKTNELFTVITGSGDVETQGIADKHVLHVTGSGDADNFSLSTKNSNISLTGSGDAKVTASTTLEASISGSGNIYYRGTPQISKAISGSGRVINAN